VTTLTIDALERWVLFGAQWRIVELTEERAVVESARAPGSPSSAWNATTPGLIGYLRIAQRDPD
jgi:hypothetical protein